MMTLVTMLIGAKSYAATTLTDAKAYNLGLELVRADQYGYKISGGRIVWRIYNYAQNSNIFEVDGTKYIRLQSPKDRTNQYYCLRAEYGFLQTEATNLMYETEKYNKEYDMENANDKFAIMNILTGAGAISQTETSKYNKIMWILDNMYVPEKGNKEEIIEKAMNEYTGDKTYFPNKATNAAIYNNEELIDVVQQLAIWHYTNAEDEAYNKDTISTIFRNTNKVNTSTSFDYGEMEFKSLTDLLNVRPRIGQEEEEGSFEGTELQNEADALYQYLVKNASGSYTGAKTGTITLTGTGAKSEYSVGTKKYVVGPYTYTTSGEVAGIELNVYKELNNTETKITDKVKILDSNKQEYTGTAEGLKGKEFYVELPMTEEVDKIKVEVKGNKTKTSKKVLVGTTEGTVYQPVVKVEVEETEVKEEVETEIEKPEFDLSLRKYITKVNGTDVTETRNPEVKTNETLDKDKTTAEYNHKKDPVVVETGDVVTYRITVYNEGEVDGYAKVITDRLPSGMEYVEGQNIEGYTVAYNRETNQVTFTRTKTDNISAYTGNGTISSETIEFTCKVTKEVGTKNQVLTNIAWIAEDKNEYGIKDRDSKTEEKPNPSEENLPGYTGKGTNKEDLTDKNYYYEGEQDDDDFEKVVIKGTTLDLNLQKYISKVVRGGETATSPRTESERYYPTIDNERHLADKKANPVVVGPKDMVIYTIKVCNQGKLAGYAKEITDVLPEGVEYITSNEAGYEEGYRINEEYGWSYDANTRTAKTTYLSKENGEGNILNAYDGAKNEDDTPKYDTKYVQIAVKVKDTAKGTMLNMAAITKHSDREGNEDVDDTDSTPSNGIENENEDDTDGDVIRLPEFDLSLRKYITKVNGTDVTETRNPEVKTSETLDKDKTTAEYNHRKNPVVVKTGDVVTYKITIYNEGEIDGYAKVITDKLPSGMEYIQGQSIEGYIATYNKETNEVKFERTKTSNLKAYTGNGTISSETIEFTCKVTGESSTKEQVLTNIAWIAEDKNEYGIKDRDSKTEEKPDTNETKLPGYTGKETNKKDLTDKNYYYEGEQDDDDFEKVILPAKEFDLSLKKFITEVNHKGQTREITLRDEKTRDNKKQEPVSVETGDLVTYTIRVYNEGEISGYASEITDSIPEGVKFVVDNEINKKYLWTLSEDEQTIKTTYLSKDNEIKDGENLLEAYDGKTYAYKEVKAVFEVISTDTERSIINIAEITKDTDKDGKEIDDRDSTPGNRQERTGEDDTDEEAIKLQHFDLSLKKYISKVGTDTTKTRNLETKIDEEGKITYELDKTPIKVRAKDTVTYVIRIYNEGQIDGYAKEITDRLPEYLEYKEDSEVNKKYLWSYDKETNEIKTEYLSKEKEQTEGANLIKAYDKENKQIYYKEVEVECKVKEGSEDRQIINIAEITKDTDKDGKEIDDIDSTPNNKIEGEDDQDYEVIYVEYFDLSLKKFITKIGNTAINNRYPEVSKNAEGKLTYKDNKSVLEVENGDIVIYTIRVYNEGTIAGYAEEVTDRLPEGLEYIAENEINKKYGWSYNKETNEIKTEYLSKKAGEEAKRDNLINAYNKTAEVSKTNPSYKDLEVACKVSQNATGNTNLTNIAEITKDADKDGKEIEDIDSTPNNKKDGEDDIDKETLRVKIFDLSLKKFVSKVYVTEDGKTAETKTGHTGKENPEPVVKVELNRKKIKTTKVKYEYTIQVTNEGEIAGYATEVKDYVPEGLKFVKGDNPDWTENKDGSIVTRKLENKLLNPGETAEVTVILEWINGENNMGLKTNIAEISEHKDKNKNDKVKEEYIMH